MIPDRGYLRACHELCKKHNVLFIVDEIQSGLGRAGKLLAVHHEGVRPDIVLLGKALSGGVLPVSAVLADKEIMLCIKPGQHGSTYGGNPLACAVGMAALQVLLDEDLCGKSERLGIAFRAALEALHHPLLSNIRGEGLMNAIEIDESKAKGNAWDLCCIFKEHGLITKPTHDTIIRLTPPLCITEPELLECVQIIKKSLDQFMN
jgi:ornithine--oxo-acid transaminase